MLHCPGCSASLAESDHTCPACGMPVDGSSAATLVEDRGVRFRPPRRREDEPGFPPGDLLAGRYRIVNLVGRGGMGDVYRVDDLRLGQTVALKFLPEWLASDGAALARFHREVSLARQVSHPNVCRVFDVGEARGRPFLSMEHIDGEDLSLLLQRIGRLPADKAIEIARQLCSGLAAIHDAGILHRDLKPSNVMIDARGRARITDFGVAALAGELRAGEARAGTRAYMAPEQEARGEVSVQSDLYSLGLVLYEMCTGQRPVDAPRLARPGLPPLAGRAILRCLEADPRDRPSSALAVACELPGGDPLAAALAAGETPSPEMVAAAAKEGTLRPAVAGACLAGILLCLGGIVALSGKVMAFRKVPLPHSPEILADRASNLLAILGYRDEPVDRAYGFEVHQGYYKSLRAGGRPERSKDPPLYLFWYRQSPGRLARTHGLVEPQDPVRAPGEAYVVLTPEGRLYRLEIVPDRGAVPAGPSPPPDWPALLRAAGLEPGHLSPIPPFRPPAVFADARAAWRHDSAPTRVQAAAYQGRPVSFEIVEPWHVPTDPLMQPETGQVGFTLLLYCLAFLAAAPLARKNLRLGRGDRRGAWRLALVGSSTLLIRWLLGERHFFNLEEVEGLIEVCSYALAGGALLWYGYIALEPSFRRRWPERIISWSRLLAGNVRDPLVGRDVLAGCLLGLMVALMNCCWDLLGPRFGAAPALRLVLVEPLCGAPRLLGQFSFTVLNMILASFQFALVFLLLQIVLRKERRALAGLAFIFGLAGLIYTRAHFPLWLVLLTVGLQISLLIFSWVRFGLLTDMVARLAYVLVLRYPLNPDLSVWYSGATLLVVAVVAGLALYGFATSTRRPAPRPAVLASPAL